MSTTTLRSPMFLISDADSAVDEVMRRAADFEETVKPAFLERVVGELARAMDEARARLCPACDGYRPQGHDLCAACAARRALADREGGPR